MTNQSIKISENCWKHTDEYSNVFYTKTSDPNSQLHREDGPAVETAKGNKYWFINGKSHREDGPAVEWSNGDKEWCINGKLHRKDGPACEYANGYKVWWYNDKHIDVNSQEEFEMHIKNLISI